MRTSATPVQTELPAEVFLALRQGNKIEAIKRLRLRTGLGLKEAKEEIDRIVHSHAGVYVPPRTASRDERWRGLILLAATIALAFYGYYAFLSG